MQNIVSLKSKDWLVINGSQNSNNYGLYVDTPPKKPMAAQNYRQINIPDREESLYIKEEKFEDMTLNIKGYTFSNEYDPSDLYAWLRTAKTISFNSDTAHCYRVKKVNGVIPNYSGHGKNVYTLSFVVSPFVYYTSNNAVTDTHKNFIVNNPGNYYSRPVYKIYGSGNINLAVSSDAYPTSPDMTVMNVNEYCIIDAERTLVYKDGELLKWSGKIPLLDVGDNAVFLEGSTTKCEIIVNARDC